MSQNTEVAAYATTNLASGFAMDTTLLTTTHYDATNYPIANLADARLGKPWVVNPQTSSPSKGSVDFTFDIGGSFVQYVALLWTNAYGNMEVFTNTNASPTGAPVGLGGADATWDEFPDTGNFIQSGSKSLGTLLKMEANNNLYPHRVIVASTNSSSVEKVWVRVSNEVSAPPLYIGHVWAGVLTDFERQPQRSVKRQFYYPNIDHETEYGERFTYDLPPRRGFKANIDDADMSAMEEWQELYDLQRGSKTPFLFMPDRTASHAWSGNADGADVETYFGRFTKAPEIAEVYGSDRARSNFKLEFEEEPPGYLDLS